MFELNTLAYKETTFLHLKHPVTLEPIVDEDDNKVGINLYGPSSKEFRDAMALLQKARLRREQSKKVATQEELEDEVVKLYASITESVDHLSHNGKAVEGVGATRAMYADRKLSWILEQVAEALQDRAGFLSQE